MVTAKTCGTDLNLNELGFKLKYTHGIIHSLISNLMFTRVACIIDKVRLTSLTSFEMQYSTFVGEQGFLHRDLKVSYSIKDSLSPSFDNKAPYSTIVNVVLDLQNAKVSEDFPCNFIDFHDTDSLANDISNFIIANDEGSKELSSYMKSGVSAIDIFIKMYKKPLKDFTVEYKGLHYSKYLTTPSASTPSYIVKSGVINLPSRDGKKKVSMRGLSLWKKVKVGELEDSDEKLLGIYSDDKVVVIIRDDSDYTELPKSGVMLEYLCKFLKAYKEDLHRSVDVVKAYNKFVKRYIKAKSSISSIRDYYSVSNKFGMSVKCTSYSSCELENISSVRTLFRFGYLLDNKPYDVDFSVFQVYGMTDLVYTQLLTDTINLINDFALVNGESNSKAPSTFEVNMIRGLDFFQFQKSYDYVVRDPAESAEQVCKKINYFVNFIAQYAYDNCKIMSISVEDVPKVHPTNITLKFKLFNALDIKVSREFILTFLGSDVLLTIQGGRYNNVSLSGINVEKFYSLLGVVDNYINSKSNKYGWLCAFSTIEDCALVLRNYLSYTLQGLGLFFEIKRDDSGNVDIHLYRLNAETYVNEHIHLSKNGIQVGVGIEYLRSIYEVITLVSEVVALPDLQLNLLQMNSNNVKSLMSYVNSDTKIFKYNDSSKSEWVRFGIRANDEIWSRHELDYVYAAKGMDGLCAIKAIKNKVTNESIYLDFKRPSVVSYSNYMYISLVYMNLIYFELDEIDCHVNDNRQEREIYSLKLPYGRILAYRFKVGTYVADISASKLSDLGINIDGRVVKSIALIKEQDGSYITKEEKTGLKVPDVTLDMGMINWILSNFNYLRG